ncbi:uroporphyrinogen-III synthase [Bacillus massiliigorillae]|uniref:uroporphyrinogen-III synthase n=1 Tax=Bacillus massiliigorillae TaxID=1243664 RepID=UPI00039A1FE2|nr:uroporphyrinogen-III synthase [Bacillus massiliigorillae]
METDLLLQGKTVLITREERDSKQFAEAITSYGGNAITIPLIGFQACVVTDEIQKKLDSIERYDWVVFTSKNGVKFFFQQFNRSLKNKIAVIGEKTMVALRKYGYEPQFVPTKFVAECFTNEFIPVLKKGAKVLVVKGNLARTVIANQLREQGFTCDEIILYETVMPEESENELREALKTNKCDIISFTSSSTVHHFMGIVNQYNLIDQIENSQIACIGPIAKKTAEQYGLQVDISAEKYTMEGLMESILAYFSGK